MQKKILVSNANHHRFRTAKQVSQPRQQLIKIDYHICTCFLYHPVNIVYTSRIFMQSQYIISYTFQQINLFILCRRQKVRTFKRIDRCIDFLHKEIRDTTSRTFPDKHTDNLMTFVCQLPPERQGLCQMASTLPLYDKQHFHITSAYNTGFETDSSSISYSALL